VLIKDRNGVCRVVSGTTCPSAPKPTFIRGALVQ
jgi:hypothetical protein